jgi:hypothetical protein
VPAQVARLNAAKPVNEEAHSVRSREQYSPVSDSLAVRAQQFHLQHFQSNTMHSAVATLHVQSLCGLAAAHTVQHSEHTPTTVRYEA